MASVRRGSAGSSMARELDSVERACHYSPHDHRLKPTLQAEARATAVVRHLGWAGDTSRLFSLPSDSTCTMTTTCILARQCSVC